MPVTRRRSKEKAVEEEEIEEIENAEVVFDSEDESPPPMDMEVQRKKLRQCWELASVLNFINVFEPVIESNLKISAEEIETALIEPNDSLAQLHIALLKGVVPLKKSLDDSEAWVSILSKQLAMWWPWVAEGDFPLSTVKGEEMTRYKQLDPTVRLSVLKALCEVRADQDDITSHVNDAVKNGDALSTFRKEKLGDDGKGTVYWYDGNAITGHRLYKEVRAFVLKGKAKNKDAKVAINSLWETLATNFEEFQKVVSEFSSSELQWEVSVGKAVETDAIPALRKLQKKKDRLLKLQKKQDLLSNGFQVPRITRSGRNSKPVSYRYEDYDRAIEEAIEVTQKRKTAKELDHEAKNNKRKKGRSSVGDSDNSSDSDFQESDSDAEKHSEGDNDSENLKNNAIEEMTDDKNLKNSDEEEHDETGNGNSSILHLQNLNGWMVHRPKGSRCSTRLAATAKTSVPETMNLTTKQRLRQRPTINTAAESDIVPDSEDEVEA